MLALFFNIKDKTIVVAVVAKMAKTKSRCEMFDVGRYFAPYWSVMR